LTYMPENLFCRTQFRHARSKYLSKNALPELDGELQCYEK